jgi:glutathione synthase/RimK-type ligase-like ATP-grasp enzyme
LKLSRDDASVKVMKRMNQMLGEQDLLVQPFLASVKTKGEVSLIFIEGEFVHAIKKRPTQGDFKVQGIVSVLLGRSLC